MIDSHSPVFQFYTATVTVIIAFLIYILVISKKFTDRFFRNQKKSENTVSVIFQRLSGLVLFGFIPVIIVFVLFDNGIGLYGFTLPEYNSILYIVIALVLILPIVNYFNSKSIKNIEVYPQIRKLNWTPDILLLNGFTWALYLFAYEFMFRGFLLFTAIEYIGIFYAIALNTVIYSIYHFPKGTKESIAAIPFGIILCYITIETASFFYAFLLHLTLALSNDCFSLKANPDMKISYKRKV